MKCRVDFFEFFFIKHEKFLCERLPIFFDKKKCRNISECVPDGSNDDGWNKGKVTSAHKVATDKVEELGRWEVCNAVSKHEYKNSNI